MISFHQCAWKNGRSMTTMSEEPPYVFPSSPLTEDFTEVSSGSESASSATGTSRSAHTPDQHMDDCSAASQDLLAVAISRRVLHLSWLYLRTRSFVPSHGSWCASLRAHMLPGRTSGYGAGVVRVHEGQQEEGVPSSPPHQRYPGCIQTAPLSTAALNEDSLSTEWVSCSMSGLRTKCASFSAAKIGEAHRGSRDS